MNKVHFALVVCLVFFSISSLTIATEGVTEKVEDSTESPIADMAVIESEMKTSTERPFAMEVPKQDEKSTKPDDKSPKQDNKPAKSDDKPAKSDDKPAKSDDKPAKSDEKSKSQRHTVADFIIHPLIAFKPRKPDEANLPVEGKQAGSSSSSTTPSPWQLFGFNTGAGLGSSVTSLAGSVTGWINDRIQLPGLMESPVRESTTSSSSTTTTTARPDVVVRVQHKPTTRRPIISIGDRNRPNRPNRPNFVSLENNDDEDDYDIDYSNENKDYDSNEAGYNGSYNEEEEGEEEGEGEGEGEGEEEQDGSNSYNSNESGSEDNEVEDDEDEVDNEEAADGSEEESHPQRPNNKRRPLRNNNNKNNLNNNNNNQRRRNGQQNTRRRIPYRRQQQQAGPGRRRPMKNYYNGLEDSEYDDMDNDVFYYGPSMKRSQSSPNFIQRGQQHLLNQFRQLTRGQTPGEIGAAIKSGNTNAMNKRRQQATLYVNRNGQTVYMAPEFAQSGQPHYHTAYAQPGGHKGPASSGAFPQPPLTIPLTQNGQTVQYITIPWSQLGISPPSNLVSITEGVQSKPYILNIPQSAINAMQSQSYKPAYKKKKQPQLITPEAVPLLADASLMDIFKPPKMPSSRTSTKRPSTLSSMKPVVVGKKPTATRTTPLIQKRVRPVTVIEMAPKVDETKKTEHNDKLSADEPKMDAQRAVEEEQYIIVGDDNEPGLVRQVQPVYGEARYVQFAGQPQYYDSMPRRNFYRGGRELSQAHEIPVQSMSKPDETPAESMAIQAEVTSVPNPEKMIVEEPATLSIPEIEKTQQLPVLKTA